MAGDIKLEVSVPTFHEIAGLLEAKGIDIAKAKTITLESGTALVRPIDWRLVQVRRDCVTEATKVWNTIYENDGGKKFVEFTNEIYEYVLNNKKPEEKKIDPITIAPTGWGKPNV